MLNLEFLVFLMPPIWEKAPLDEHRYYQRIKVLGDDERKTVDIFEKIRDKAHVNSHTVGAGKVVLSV